MPVPSLYPGRVSPRGLSLLLGLAALAACGPGTQATESDSATESTTVGTGGPGSCAPVPGEDPLALDGCDGFDDQSLDGGGVELTLTITNSSAEPLLIFNRYFGCGQPARYFDAEGIVGGRHVHTPNDNCAIDWPSCSSLITGEGGCTLCQTLHPVIFIEPGGSFETQWAGPLLAGAFLPDECSVNGMSGGVCDVPIPAPPGDYALVASAALAGNCAVDAEMCETGELDEGGACPIDPERTDACTITRQAIGSWNGACGAVELVFGG